jgi:hypothetical protein
MSKHKPCALRKIRGYILRAQTASEWEITREIIAEEKSLDRYQREHFTDLCIAGQWRVVAKTRTAGEWVKLLETISDPHIRGKVASVVWWDYAAKMPEVLAVMGLYGRVQFETADQVYAGLIAVGYPETLAMKRCKQPKDSHYRPVAATQEALP